MSMTPEEKQRKYEETQLKKLKEKKFKCYEFKVGDKKISESSELKPYNCKNYTGKTYLPNLKEDIYFAQTNKGNEMGKKLILRTMRQDRKEKRMIIKNLKDSIDMLNKK